MLKHKNTYEIISPEDIGLHRSDDSGIVLGKLRYGEMKPLILPCDAFDIGLGHCSSNLKCSQTNKEK